MIKKQNAGSNLQMTTGILQNKLILIQKESPGSKTNKGDPLSLFGQNIGNRFGDFFSEWNEIKLRISVKTSSNSVCKII